MIKMVNGRIVEMTEDEIRARQLEELAFENQIENYITKEKYKDDRAKEYPPIGDQLDAIWKQLNQWRISGDELIKETDTILNQIIAVKNKYPKPEEK